MLVARLRGNQTGVENRTWKSDQVIDTVTDPLLVRCVSFSCLETWGVVRV